MDSLIGSIRSMLSLNSVGQPQHNERRDSDNEALTPGDTINLDPIHVGASKHSHLKTHVTVNSHGHADMPPIPADAIMMQNGIGFKEEHLGSSYASEPP